MSSYGNIQYNYYFFHVYNRFGHVTKKSHSFRTLQGTKARASSYLYDYIDNHTDREIDDNCVSVSIYSIKQPKKPICTKYVESLNRWEYHD